MNPPSESTTTRLVLPKMSSVIESLRGCGGLSGIRIDKEYLKKMLIMPYYLRRAIRDSIKNKDPAAAAAAASAGEVADVAVGEVTPESSPMVVFINSQSGGRQGPQLKKRLQELMSEEQVTYN